MKKKCVICHKDYEARCKTQLTCCFACRKIHRQRVAIEWNHNHPDKVAEKNKKYAAAHRGQSIKSPLNENKAKQKTEIKLELGFRTEADDPQWVKDYAAADRLTRISMLVRELNNICIHKPIFTYGNVSLIYNTDKYYTLEADVIKRKRLEML